jgi:hypothetical protein
MRLFIGSGLLTLAARHTCAEHVDIRIAGSIVSPNNHWQRKILRLDQKARIPRSKAALNVHLSECVVEHVVPKMPS